MNKLGLALLCASVGFVACEDEGSDNIEITYVQGGCYGACPMFSIQVHNDRSIQYVGLRYVHVVDTVLDRITNQQFNDLIVAFQQCHYFNLKDEYTGVCVTDMSSATTSLRLGSRYKSVRHYFGDCSAPDDLRRLYHRINEIMDTKQWVGREVLLVFPENLNMSGM